MIVGCGVRDHPATHTVARDGNARGVNAQFHCICRVSQIRQNRVGILQILRKSKCARAAPGTAVVESDGIPTRTAHGLRQVEILFVSRQTVAYDQRGMRTGAGRRIHQSVDARTMTRDVEHRHRCRMRGIRGRIGEDCRRH